ncbi:hypothetical protein AA313_de0210337 [Arthrobotrys entomopaga]|nr:hypothetical protein AA313_de0210337 [Arthrobotrys entomopaga]
MPPPLDKTILTIPSSPPLPPVAAAAGQKRFLDVDPSSDDIPVFSSDDLPPREVFANPYHAYRRSARTVKRQRSGTIQSLYLKNRADAFLSSDQLEQDGLPSSSSKSKSTQDTVWSEGYDDDDEEANTSMSTIVPPGSEDVFEGQDILPDITVEDPQDIEANLIIQKAIENGSQTIQLSIETYPSNGYRPTFRPSPH